MIPRSIRKQLPKAKLFWLRLRHTSLRAIGSRRVWRAKFRNANVMFVWFGPLEMGWRMPWLERPARQLYPHLFAEIAA